MTKKVKKSKDVNTTLVLSAVGEDTDRSAALQLDDNWLQQTRQIRQAKKSKTTELRVD